MGNHDKIGSEIHGFVLLEEHGGNNAGNGVKKAVKEGGVIEKKLLEVFINGQVTVSVGSINQLKGHRGSAVHDI